jgi:hypothetical protein
MGLAEQIAGDINNFVRDLQLETTLWVFIDHLSHLACSVLHRCCSLTRILASVLLSPQIDPVR